jgi:hypothetical protein
VVHGADTVEASPARKLVAGGAPGELVLATTVLWLSILREEKEKEMEGEQRKAAAPAIREGGQRLTSSEEDGGFSSLFGCDLNGDGLRGGRREVSAAAEGSECGGRLCGDPTSGGVERGRATTVAWRAWTRDGRLRTRGGRNGAFMARAWQ